MSGEDNELIFTATGTGIETPVKLSPIHAVRGAYGGNSKVGGVTTYCGLEGPNMTTNPREYTHMLDSGRRKQFIAVESSLFFRVTCPDCLKLFTKGVRPMPNADDCSDMPGLAIGRETPRHPVPEGATAATIQYAGNLIGSSAPGGSGMAPMAPPLPVMIAADTAINDLNDKIAKQNDELAKLDRMKSSVEAFKNGLIMARDAIETLKRRALP